MMNLQPLQPQLQQPRRLTKQQEREKQQPWTEKYRPTDFSDIVLDPLNRQLFANIIQYKIFPNLLLYGPGGTGKTTTAMALVHSWFRANQKTNHMPMIVLNASDDRGIDVIRNQIQQFAQSKNMFEDGYKFVILDEVDAMTKTAQNALKIILQTSMSNVRFCLICNYISRIDDSLRNEFISVRFHQLPPTDIFRFIRKIADAEKVNITNEEIYAVQKLYNADIRSMINFIQLHQYCNSSTNAPTIIVDQTWEELLTIINTATATKEDKEDAIRTWIYQISTTHNIEPQSLCLQYFMYMLINYPEQSCTQSYLDNIETIVHTEPESDMTTVVDFFIYTIQTRS
jgi:DNA polymerase III delta prime subunit